MFATQKMEVGRFKMADLFASLRGLVAGFGVAEPGKDAARLALRLIGARAMSVVTLVVAAWFVDIEAFAEFGVYQSAATLVWIAIFLRYDTAIVAAPTARESAAAVRLCIAIGTVLWAAASLSALGLSAFDILRSQLLLFFPLAILMRAVLRLVFAITTREGDFTGIGRASLVQSLVQPTLLIILVMMPLRDDALCFVIADVVGHASGAAYLGWRQRQHLSALATGWSRQALAIVAWKWRALPLYNLPGAFLSLAFVMSPLLITPMVASAVMAGHVALAYRIFDVPTQIITASSTPIFLHRMRPVAGKANALFGRQMMLGLVILIGAAYAFAAGLIVGLDPWLDPTELADLPKVVPVIATFQLFVALAAPLNDSCALYPQQRGLVLINGAALAGSLLAFMFAAEISPHAALVTLATVSCMRALALGELLRKLSRISRQVFDRNAAR
jgi:hypothetical protein